MKNKKEEAPVIPSREVVLGDPSAPVSVTMFGDYECISCVSANEAIMKLVEVVKGEQTSDAVIEKLVSLVQQMNKVPVVCKDAPGFIVNRVARPYYIEALRLAEEGVADYCVADGDNDGKEELIVVVRPPESMFSLHPKSYLGFYELN